MAKIEDVAQRAGVSVATVSRALRGLPNVADETRRRVEAAARELDYVGDPSASRLAAGRTRTLGIVLPHLGTWYSSRLMAAVHDVWQEEGFDLLAIVLRSHAGRERFLRQLPFRKRVDGLLLMDLPFAAAEEERLRSTGVAVVTAGPPSATTPSVGIDNRAAAHALVEHLLELGHRDIALLEADLEQPFHWAGPTDRLAGVEEALAAAGIDVPPHRRATTDWSPASGVAGTEQLLEHDPPTALLCFSDELAIAAMGVLERRGLAVPWDVSVVGFDDHLLAPHVGLTTIHQPVDTLGRRAAGLLVDQLRGGGAATARREVLPTRLVVRGSTAAPRDEQASGSGPGRSRRVRAGARPAAEQSHDHRSSGLGVQTAPSA